MKFVRFYQFANQIKLEIRNTYARFAREAVKHKSRLGFFFGFRHENEDKFNYYYTMACFVRIQSINAFSFNNHNLIITS